LGCIPPVAETTEAAMLTIQDKVELAGLAFGTVFVLVGLFAVIADSLV
jgi:hypothetical protein